MERVRRSRKQSSLETGALVLDEVMEVWIDLLLGEVTRTFQQWKRQGEGRWDN